MSARRAPALRQEERRRHLVEVTMELVRERHELPSTRDIAKAAGIAEGTMFRAFDTKEALANAIVGAVACPVPLRTAISAIDPALPLRERTLAAIRLLMDRFTGLLDVLGPLGVAGPPQHHAHPGCPDPSAQIPTQTARTPAGEATHEPRDAGGCAERSALVTLFLPDAAQLRLDPEEFAHVLRLLAFGNASRHIGRAQTLSAQDVTDLLLDGAVRRPEPDADGPTGHAATHQESTC